MQKEWFSSWFDTPYYHTLYKNRDYAEASLFIDNITQYLKLKQDCVCWDLCCGKGRHSIYLNKKGYRVIGTDLSACSIFEANKSANDSLEFYQHDMRKLFRTNYFDVVFNVFTSFGYFEKREDDLHVFDSVQKSLKSGGLFVFDYLNSEYVKGIIKPTDTITMDDITFNIKKKIEGITVIKSINFTDKGHEFNFEERVKLFDKAYFEGLAADCNLSILYAFGNYQLESFNQNTSPRLILVLQKKMNLGLLTLYLALPVLVTGIIFLSLKIKAKNLRFLLAFSAAYLFAISVTHLLPECYEGSNYKLIGMFILIGFFIQILLEYFSAGIEHGHIHAHSDSCKKHLPLGMIAGLYLHSLLEGLPIYQSGIIESHTEAVLSTQQSLVFGITIHNIPIAIAFVTLLLEHQSSKVKTFLLLMGFALMAPLGCFISYLLNSFGVQNYDGFMKLSFGVVIGIFLHISTAIMFETGENHRYNLAKIMSMIAGVCLAALIS